MAPCIYFYDDNFESQNAENIIYINYIALLHPQLKVFKIDFKDQLSFNPLSPPDEKSKIYLYYKGEVKYESTISTKENIDFLFIKCLEFYNSYIENISQNTGSKGKRIPKDDKNPELRYRKELTEDEIRSFEVRRRYVLNRKIKSSVYISVENHKDLQNSSTETDSKNLCAPTIIPIIEKVKIVIIR